MNDALPSMPQVVVPDMVADPNARPALVFADMKPTHAQAVPASAGGVAGGPLVAGIAGGSPVAAAAAVDAFGFPSLDPLMALGTSTPLFATLAQWQRMDLPAALARVVPQPAAGSSEGTVVPINLIPH